jgi:hypothetical protein
VWPALPARGVQPLRTRRDRREPEASSVLYQRTTAANLSTAGLSAAAAAMLRFWKEHRTLPCTHSTRAGT